jgi:hypothetical protein
MAGGKLLTGIVKDIILKDDDTNLLNTIGVHISEIPNKIVVAAPYDSNIKRVPLLGEVVLLVQSHSGQSKPSDVSSNTKFYYLNPISLQNSIHNNALPESKTIEITNNNTQYSSTQTGNPNTSRPKNNIVNLGKGFVETRSINQVQPFIGDVIFEGRFGHSLRFGYTPSQSDTSHRPTWNSINAADPIVILSNGRGSSKGSGKYTIEDINDDKSSIWLSTTQTIPITPSQKLTLGVIPQKSFNKPTLVFNSDRIFLNSKSDYIILSSAKSVSISTPNWAADMDKVFTILEGVIKQLSDLVSAKATFATGTGPTGPATNLAQVNQLLAQLKQMSQ